MSISHCRTRRRLVALAATATLAGLASPGLMAQGAFPSKAITMVVPYPPGGSNDVFARQVAKEMGDLLKQTVIVDNRPGASGNTGTASVAKAAADGYTLVAVSSSMTTNAAVQAKMPFDPVKDLAPVAMFAKGPLVVAVNNEFPARTPQDLVRAIKATKVEGDTRFLDKLEPRFAATDLVDDRFVRKAIQAVGGPQVFGIPADFSRRETIVV